MKLQHYTNSIKYLYYILFFMLPFVVLPVNSELFEFNKMLFIYIITSLIVCLWVLRCLQENTLIIKKTPFDVPLILFLGSQIMSTLFSIDQHTSFFGYYGRFNGGLLSTMVYIVLYYGFVTHITENIQTVIRTIFKISIVSSLFVVLWGLPGRFNHDLSCLLFTSKFDNTCWTAQFRPAERMFSTLGQPNWLGAYLSITFFISFFILFSSVTKKARMLSVAGILFSYIGILLSRSRSSLASLIPGFIVFGIFYLFLTIKKHHWLSPLRRKTAAFTIGALLLVTFICQTGIPQLDTFLSLSFLNRNDSKTALSTTPPPPKPFTAGRDGRGPTSQRQKALERGWVENL